MAVGRHHGYYGSARNVAAAAARHYGPAAVRAAAPIVARAAKRAANRFFSRSRTPKRGSGPGWTALKGAYSGYRRPKSLKSRVYNLECAAALGQGCVTYKSIGANSASVAAGTTSYVDANSLNLSGIELAISQLKYYDPATPGTLVTADASVGSYDRKVCIASVMFTTTVVNNSTTPCYVEMYEYAVIKDTSSGLLTWYDRGVTDQVYGNTSYDQIHPSELKQVSEVFRMKKCKKKVLKPGKSMTLRSSRSKIDYDPAVYDGETDIFRRKLKCFVQHVRFTGMYGHDTSVADEIDTMPGQLDFVTRGIYKIKYNAGANLKYIYVNDGRAGFTNSGLQGQQPVADVVPHSYT